MLCKQTDLKVWVVGSPVGELLLSDATIQPCSLHLSLALQTVSGFRGELDWGPAHDTCPWLSRK